MLEIGIIFVLILINSLLAMAEAGVVAARKIRLQSDAKAGLHGAKDALKTVESPVRALSTVQIGITLIGIFSGVFGGATIADDLAHTFVSIPLLAPIAKPLALGVVVVVITYFSLVLGELVPKRLGMEHPEAVLRLLARPMHLLSTIASPIVSLLTFSTALLLKPLGVGTQRAESVSDEEIRSVIRMGTTTGVLEVEEGAVIERIFALADRRVGSFMTPRRDVVCLHPDATPEQIAQHVQTSTTTQLPVSPGGLDEIVGIVSVLDLARVGTHRMQEILKPPLFIPETANALRAVKLFRSVNAQIACVTDEHGTIEGLIRLVDLLEDILGEVNTKRTGTPQNRPSHRRGNTTPNMIQRQPNGSMLIDGLLPTAEFLEEIDESAGTLFDPARYHALGGMMIHKLGRVARVGDDVCIGPWRFEVVSMNHKRIGQLRVSRQSKT